MLFLRVIHRHSRWNTQYGSLNLHKRSLPNRFIGQSKERKKMCSSATGSIQFGTTKKRKEHKADSNNLYWSITRWKMKTFQGNFRISNSTIYQKKQWYISQRESYRSIHFTSSNRWDFLSLSILNHFPSYSLAFWAFLIPISAIYTSLEASFLHSLF